MVEWKLLTTASLTAIFLVGCLAQQDIDTYSDNASEIVYRRAIENHKKAAYLVQYLEDNKETAVSRSIDAQENNQRWHKRIFIKLNDQHRLSDPSEYLSREMYILNGVRYDCSKSGEYHRCEETPQQAGTSQYGYGNSFYVEGTAYIESVGRRLIFVDAPKERRIADRTCDQITISIRHPDDMGNELARDIVCFDRTLGIPLHLEKYSYFYGSRRPVSSTLIEAEFVKTEIDTSLFRLPQRSTN